MLKYRMILRALCAVWLLFPLLVAAQKFTIPVFPDTQNHMGDKRGIFLTQLEWIAAKADSLKAPIVLHVGDLVNFDNFDHWELASVGMRILDRAKVPYAITLGNHDTGAVGQFSGSAAPGNVNVNLRNTQKFNYFFPVNRFPLQQGRFEKEKSDNAYYLFEAGGLQWIVITLEFCAREAAAQWMDATLKQFPNHNAIILTHSHLTSQGEISPNNAGYGDMKVIDIYNQYIKPHKNVLMVLSGHVCYSAWRDDKGDNGNTIYQILQDYQCNEDLYIRLLDIDVEKKTITAKMFSPVTHTTLDDRSRFTFTNVQFIQPAQERPNQAVVKELPHPPVVRGFMMGSTSVDDCKDAKAWGANVIRVQLAPASFASQRKTSLTDAMPAFLDRVETQVENAIEAGLKVVIDLHQPPFENVKSFDHAEFWERNDLEEGFCRFWTALVKRLQPYKAHIWGYDLLNEPLDRSQLPGVTRQWKPVAEKIVRAIREIDKDTWIIFEPGPGSLFTGFRGLEPLDDPKIIYSGHFYEPQDFTHQGVFNIAGTDLAEAKTKTGVTYPGTVHNTYWDKARLEQFLKAADDFQKRWDVPIYVGEFSVIRWAPEESALQWLRDALSLFEARGWSWTYHAFREFHGWSLEYDGTFWMQGLPRPEQVAGETERAKIVKKELAKNNQ